MCCDFILCHSVKLSCTTLMIRLQSVKLYSSLIYPYTSTALDHVVSRIEMLWWISWTRFVLATVSRYYLKNTMIDKKINPRLFFILPSSKNFLLRLGCFLVNILLRGWKFPEFCLETNTNRTQYNCFINTDRLPFQILRQRLTFLREILGL